MPQSSAHLPANVPSRVGVRLKPLLRPGMTSILNKNAGTQNEWMTSCERSLKCTFLSTGR